MPICKICKETFDKVRPNGRCDLCYRAFYRQRVSNSFYAQQLAKQGIELVGYYGGKIIKKIHKK